MIRRPHRAVLALALLLAAAGAARDGFDAWVDATVLPPLAQAVSQELRDRNGRLIRVFPVEDGRWRLATTVADVDPGYLEMLIAVEDKRFRSHAGVDPRAMLRAGAQAVRHGRIVSGGSTLTMQAARLLENSGTGGWAGKLRQIRVALALERRHDKDRILSIYLTHAPFGGNIEGVRAASRAWFGKPPARLSREEAALLVALPQSPETRRPDRAPDAATAARDRILAREGHAEPFAAVPRDMRALPRIAPHLADRVRAAGAPPMRLTLDAALQRQAEALARRAMAGQVEGMNVAMILADHGTGEILAHVGSAGYDDRAQGFVDMTRAVRSPGSTLKPLVYALAFDQGLVHPATLIRDAPTRFEGGYAPVNFDNLFRGDVTVARALQLSLNIPPVKLTERMGPARITAALRRSGAEPALRGQPGLAVALGGIGLSLEELVQLYAGLAAGGRSVPLHAVPAAGAAEPARRIVSEGAAWQVGAILSQLVPPDGGEPGRIAYKTGTSYGHRDAWAIGHDGRFVAGVWMGRADGTPVPGAFGGELAAPLLFELLSRASPLPAPLPAPPDSVLTVSTSELPRPLQRFRETTGDGKSGGVALAFPPDGARLETGSGPVLVKLDGGRAPFAILADGMPVLTGARAREFLLEIGETGFARIEVIDAAGASDAVTVWLD